MNLMWFVAGIIVGLAMGLAMVLVITCTIVSNKDSRNLER